jgi:hypothetical protein
MLQPRDFYFLDMNVLVLDVLHSKSLKPFGRVEIHDIVELNGTNPIDKYVFGTYSPFIRHEPGYNIVRYY